jgi:hypothetical protein
MLPPSPDRETTQLELKKAEEMLQWLNARF